MQALRVHDFAEPPRLDTLADPEPAPGEVRVRVLHAGISYFDLLIARGAYQWRPPLPFVVGSELAGEVDALGDGVVGLSVGQPVCGSLSIGGWGQRICVPAGALQPVPPQVPLDEAAVLLTPYGTALYALRERGGLQRGETVLVLGATGSIGDAAVQTARALGARVIAAASGPAKQAVARAAGAEACVDLLSKDWKDQVKALAGPRGVDVVVDPIGGDATDTAFRTLGWGGRHLMVGFAGGSIGSLRGNLAIVKGAALVGVDLRQFREREPDAMARLLADVAALHASGQVRPRIAARFGLAQVQQALDLAGARTTTGRVLLDF